METLHGWHFFAGDISKPDIVAFVEKANFTETMFLDTVVYEGTRFNKKVILYVKTHFQLTETLQHTHLAPSHPLICQLRRSLKPLKWRLTRKVFQILKRNSWYGQRLPTQFEKKLLSEINETHRNWKSEKKCCLSWHNTSPYCLL